MVKTQKASINSQGHGMTSYFIPTCHFCGVDGYIRPNCFKYIKKCRIYIMIERNRAIVNMHVPRKSRTNEPKVTRKEKVSPRWIRRDEYFC